MSTIGREQIERVIPHRTPFLLLDSIVEVVEGKMVMAERYIDPADPVFEGHFPNYQVYPGVLLIENMAQTACYALASAEAGEEIIYVLARVNQCTFRCPVHPGDKLLTTARLERDFRHLVQFNCEIHVAGELATQAELLVGRSEKEK